MSFSFGFNNDDFSDDEIDDQKVDMNYKSEVFINPLDQIPSNIDAKNLPESHTLESILSTLVNVRLTFDNYTTPVGQNLIYRRELFDVKHQIMCEDSGSNNLTSKILIGESEEFDLKKNYYEGGFKSWECSYDTIDKLAMLHKENKIVNFKSFLELGCGTTLPTSFLLKTKFETKDLSPASYIMSDFNYDVLRLVTLPNLLINWASTLRVEDLNDLTTSKEGPSLANDELLLTSSLLSRFRQDLKDYNVELKFISGSWGRQFNKIVENYSIDFIITSETIYSLESLPIVAESILEIISHSTATSAIILVAAKNMYFGVGGSVIEFLNYINRRKTVEYNVSTEEVNDAQLKRSIITIEYCT